MKAMVMRISELPGLGPKSQDMLETAGIDSIEMLRQLGSVAAYLQVKRSGAGPSLNLLWGLESAISGVNWKEIAKTERTRLLMALDQMESNQ